MLEPLWKHFYTISKISRYFLDIDKKGCEVSSKNTSPETIENELKKGVEGARAKEAMNFLLPSKLWNREVMWLLTCVSQVFLQVYEC